MILYKAEAPTLYKPHLRSLVNTINPFNQMYGFTPSNPIFFMNTIQAMLDAWSTKGNMNQFYAKTLLYQIVHYVNVELKNGNVRYIEPDYVLWVKEYLDRHFTEPVSIQALSDMLPLNRSVLGRLFRKRENSSMQEYLIKKRIEAAKVCLEETNASIQEIAFGSGFTDEYNMIRMFKKYVHESPGEYRRKRAMHSINCDIDNNYHSPYNERGLEDLVKSYRDGEFAMFGQTRNKSMLATAVLIVMLLLSACAPGGAINNGEAKSQSNTQVQQIQDNQNSGQASEKPTRIVSTTLGDVEVPLNPERVVVQYLMGDVISLGIVPIGISDVYEGAAFSESVSEAEALGWWADWEPETIMALDPDLILVISEEDAYKFSKIAPTVFIPQGDMTQDERIAFLGEVLGKQEEAAEVIATYDANLNKAKEELAQAGFDQYTVTVFESTEESIMEVHGDKYGAGGVVYASLGLNAPEKVKTKIIDKDSYSEAVSFEVLPEYAGDFIIRNAFEGMVDLSNHKIWTALPAVQNNRVIEMAFGLSYYSDIYSATAQVEFVKDSLLRTLE
ncbi:hypothetical protein PA598K_05371 [Paenibacillus sp. 598K]|nr:hypothetical protein PA598K_05371 [Paenibacillus sp. 598K]